MLQFLYYLPTLPNFLLPKRLAAFRFCVKVQILLIVFLNFTLRRLYVSLVKEAASYLTASLIFGDNKMFIDTTEAYTIVKQYFKYFEL